MRNKRKIEFSKVILFAVSAITIIVTFFTLAVVWNTSDTSALMYLIPAVYAELATATGFYYTKAKAENKIKLRQKYGEEIYKDTQKGETYYYEDQN